MNGFQNIIHKQSTISFSSLLLESELSFYVLFDAK